jgi:hypothetical protein
VAGGTHAASPPHVQAPAVQPSPWGAHVAHARPPTPHSVGSEEPERHAAPSQQPAHDVVSQTHVESEQ